MKLTLQRKTDLAMGALNLLKDSGERLRSSQLAEELGSSPEFLFHVMTPLTRAGWVDSERGPTGGYRLAASLVDVSVLDVIEAVEGSFDTATCVLRGGPCGSDETCSVHDAFLEARAALLAELARIPIGIPNSEERYQ